MKALELKFNKNLIDKIIVYQDNVYIETNSTKQIYTPIAALFVDYTKGHGKGKTFKFKTNNEYPLKNIQLTQNQLKQSNPLINLFSLDDDKYQTIENLLNLMFSRIEIEDVNNGNYYIFNKDSCDLGWQLFNAILEENKKS